MFFDRTEVIVIGKSVLDHRTKSATDFRQASRFSLEMMAVCQLQIRNKLTAQAVGSSHVHDLARYTMHHLVASTLHILLPWNPL